MRPESTVAAEASECVKGVGIVRVVAQSTVLVGVARGQHPANSRSVAGNQPVARQLAAPRHDALNTTATIQTLLDEVKSQPERASPTRRARRVQRPDATVRVHPDVREEFKRRSRQAGLSLCQYNAEVIPERLGLATRADRTEALRLAM